MKSCITLDINSVPLFFMSQISTGWFLPHYNGPIHLAGSMGPRAPLPLWVVANSEEWPWSTASGGSTQRRTLHTTREHSSPQVMQQLCIEFLAQIGWGRDATIPNEAITLFVEFDSESCCYYVPKDSTSCFFYNIDRYFGRDHGFSKTFFTHRSGHQWPFRQMSGAKSTWDTPLPLLPGGCMTETSIWMTRSISCDVSVPSQDAGSSPLGLHFLKR